MGKAGVGMDDRQFDILIKELNARLDRIENGIFGDEKIGTDGIVKRLKQVERDVEVLDAKVSKFLWMSAGVAGGATGLVQWLSKLVQ